MTAKQKSFDTAKTLLESLSNYFTEPDGIYKMEPAGRELVRRITRETEPYFVDFGNPEVVARLWKELGYKPPKDDEPAQDGDDAT